MADWDDIYNAEEEARLAASEQHNESSNEADASPPAEVQSELPSSEQENFETPQESQPDPVSVEPESVYQINSWAPAENSETHDSIEEPQSDISYSVEPVQLQEAAADLEPVSEPAQDMPNESREINGWGDDKDIYDSVHSVFNEDGSRGTGFTIEGNSLISVRHAVGEEAKFVSDDNQSSDQVENQGQATYDDGPQKLLEASANGSLDDLLVIRENESIEDSHGLPIAEKGSEVHEGDKAQVYHNKDGSTNETVGEVTDAGNGLIVVDVGIQGGDKHMQGVSGSPVIVNGQVHGVVVDSQIDPNTGRTQLIAIAVAKDASGNVAVNYEQTTGNVQEALRPDNMKQVSATANQVVDLGVNLGLSALGAEVFRNVAGENPDAAATAGGAFASRVVTGVINDALHGDLHVDQTLQIAGVAAAGAGVTKAVTDELEDNFNFDTGSANIGGMAAGSVVTGVLAGLINGHIDVGGIAKDTAMGAAESYVGMQLAEAFGVSAQVANPSFTIAGLQFQPTAIVGGFVLGQMFGDSKEAALGSQIGQAIGTAMAGPIAGLALGMVGGIIGGLFASKEKERTGQFLSNSDEIHDGAQSKLGTLGVGNTEHFKGKDGESVKDFVQTIAQVDDAVVDALGLDNAQLNQAKQNLKDMDKPAYYDGAGKASELKKNDYDFGGNKGDIEFSAGILTERYSTVLATVNPKLGDFLLVTSDPKDSEKSSAALNVAIELGQQCQQGKISEQQLDQVLLEASKEMFNGNNVAPSSFHLTNRHSDTLMRLYNVYTTTEEFKSLSTVKASEGE